MPARERIQKQNSGGKPVGLEGVCQIMDMDTNGTVRSMTGYGRAQATAGGREITVEIRSVNHRFFEYSTRIPRAYAYLEDKIKSLVKNTASRGKIEITVSIQNQTGNQTKVKIDHQLAREYLKALRELSEDLQIPNNITVSQLARYPDLFTVSRVVEEEDEIWNLVQPVVTEACASFAEMRLVEGRKMVGDLLNRLDEIEKLVHQVEELSPQTVANYRARLFAKLQEILGDTSIDEQRILTEAAIFAEKVAVAEETVRIESHLHQFRQILDEGGAVGRKLDFLVQELNREANTIGSKAQDMQIAKIVVDLKSEIEKIREQIQNIE